MDVNDLIAQLRSLVENARSMPMSASAVINRGDALDLIALLHGEFDGRRRELLAARAERQGRLDAGDSLTFPSGGPRQADWTVPPAPPDLQDRRQDEGDEHRVQPLDGAADEVLVDERLGQSGDHDAGKSEQDAGQDGQGEPVQRERSPAPLQPGWGCARMCTRLPVRRAHEAGDGTIPALTDRSTRARWRAPR